MKIEIKIKKSSIFLFGWLLWGCSTTTSLPNQSLENPPNVILIMTDDQGIGDLSCHGNPYLKTPNLDAFYEESVRFTNFHVSPYCTPTRAALMTGQYPINNGAWATFKGRDALSPDAYTLADLFKNNGYKTGLFGKWHLGDNYPVRPTDSGFEVAVHHKAGGVGELSDYWGNNYFDDTYYVNNEPKSFKGYCTDVWFQEAQKFIENTDEPFFVYLPTNAPHSPLVVPEKYAAPFRPLVGEKVENAAYLGMIANINENFGKLDQYLKEKGLAENTIVIFMTDNGTQYGYKYEKKWGHNKGFRGNKGGRLEGAHRVPFFIRWPKKGIEGGKDINELTAHIDILPTLAGLTNIAIPSNLKIDGLDVSTLLFEESTELPDRTVFLHHLQDWRPPSALNNTCFLQNQWRLINGKELYDIEQDQLQLNNVAGKYQQVVDELLRANTNFLKGVSTSKAHQELPVNIVGNPKQKEIKLTIQHAIGEDRGIWKPEQVAAGMTNTNNTHNLQIEKAGKYRISCRRWPKECSGPIQGIPTKNPKNLYDYQPITPEKVRIQIASYLLEKEIKPTDDEVIFDLQLEKGKTFLVTDFIEGKERYGVYYTYVEYLAPNN